MKKLLFLVFALASTQMAFAADTANIKIKISGATSDNRYFLCVRNAGCLSILAAQKGKVFPLHRTLDMSALYIKDINGMRLSPQGLPASCKGTVDINQTITISGKMATSGNNVRVNALRCTIS